MSRIRVIYITGLGDDDPINQRRAVKLWKMYGVEPVFFQVHWSSNETFDDKLSRLLECVDEAYEASGRKVGVIAVSAGASIALHAYMHRLDIITGIVSICGKIGRPEYVFDVVKSRNPAFATSMNKLSATIDSIPLDARKRIMCLYPFADRIVDPGDQVLDGAMSRRVWSVGHVVTITLQITLGAFRNIRYLRG